MGDTANPFSEKGKVSQEQEQYTQGKINQFNNESEGYDANAKSKTEGTYDYVQDTSGQSINPHNQNSNYAVGGGEYGRFNNRDYGLTLRLAREADAYNNKPVNQMFSVGTRHTGGVKNLGTGYERPRIQTMETRAMEQTQQLDTAQKSLAQQLQAAINRKDLDAFIAAYQQMYGITLDQYHAQIAMTQMARQLQTQQMLTKDMADWQAHFTRAFSAQTAAVIMNKVQTEPMFATYLSYYLTGQATPEQAEYVSSQIETARAEELMNTQSMDYRSALAQARRETQNFYQQESIKSMYDTTYNDRYFGAGGRREQKKQVKAERKNK